MKTSSAASAPFVVAAVLVATASLALAACGGLAGSPAGPRTAVAIASQTAGADLSPEPHAELVGRYCVRCHNPRLLRGGLTLDEFDVARAGSQAEIAEKMIRKLQAGLMPPPPAPRPDNASLERLTSYLIARVDSTAQPNPGRRTFQRLNRAEYAASIRDLLGIEVDVQGLLPPDTISQGFDNIADVQTLSPTLMEGYLRAAGKIARDALGNLGAGPSEATYKVPRTASQLERVAEAPFGTRGGRSVMHAFPADGDYTFKVVLHGTPTGSLFGATAEGEQIEISIDGDRVALLDIDPLMSESDPNGMSLESGLTSVRFGSRRVTAAFVQRFVGPVDDLIAPIHHTLADTQIGIARGITTLPHLRSFSIGGPFHVTGVSDAPTRRGIFSCRPTAPADELPCAEQIVSRLATQAYRRPLEEHDLAGLMSFYEAGATQGDSRNPSESAAQGDFESGIRTALQAILASPHFVFRLERVPGDAAAGADYPIDDLDLASRLSYFIWGSAPDTELLALAGEARLSEPEVLKSEVLRLLDDPRSEALATRFAAQWLRLQDLERIHPDALAYPQFDQTLAQSMRRETELFFENLVREDRSVLELLHADYTFVDQRLASHYGISGVAGTGFRRVKLEDENRRGLLGHASVLTQTSHANRTSPVLRGKWVMEVLLGTPPPPPPPDVPDLEETEGAADGKLLSVRERLEEHRSNPACQSCHRVIDPIGLALENFDVTGAWRTKDNGNPVDASGELYDGSPLSGPSDLRAALLSRPKAFLTTFTENLFAYGTGRRVGYHDMPAIRAIVGEAAHNDHRMSSFIVGVATSPAFRMSRAETLEASTQLTEAD